MADDSKPYGLWPSPITPKSMSLGMRLSAPQWDTGGQTLVWLEGRSGSGVLVAAQRGEAANDLTTDLSVRARVGYGGGDFTVGHGQVVFASGGRLYRQPLNGGTAKPITPGFGQAAAPAISPDGEWVAFVHSYEDRDVLALVDSAGKLWPQVLLKGNDFYMQPAWHPDSRQLAVVSWDFPNMPWDGTELRLIDLKVVVDGRLYATATRTLAGAADTAVFQPAFSPDGKHLAYTSDATGWGHVYVYDLANDSHRQLSTGEVEHAQPAWVQGMGTLAWRADSVAVFAVRSQLGSEALWEYHLESGEAWQMPTDGYTTFDAPTTAPDNTLATIASGDTTPPRVITIVAGAAPHVIRRSRAETVPADAYASAEPISWQADDGSAVYGLFYPPAGPPRAGELPPLIVNVHGGPTSHRTVNFNADAQYWATRGYAVMEVNYRGSTGYGREYMLKGRGTWGLYDQLDSVSGAQYLADAGRVDPKRMIIKGGSAGGTTVLMTLVKNPGFFKAGVCLFGVSNMFTLAADTHKFEARYLDMVIGKLPQEAGVYRERSALFMADSIVDPIIIYQGEDDEVVPRDQSDKVVDSLQHRGITHEYHVYEGEGHGWRKAETIAHYYKTLEAFLRTHVLFS